MENSTDELGFPKRQDDFAAQNPFVSPLAVESREHGYVTRSGEPLYPWVSMWTKPRETVRQQLDNDPTRNVLLLGVLTGVAGQAGNNVMAMAPELGQRVATLVALVLVGAIFGVIWLYVSAWLVGVAGRLLGGVARALECRTALAWSTVPGLWMAPLNALIGIHYLTTGPAAILVQRPGGPPVTIWAQFAIMPPWTWVIMSLGMLVVLWQIVVASRAVGEAHQFSSLRGFGTLILTFFVVIALVIAVAIAVAVFLVLIAMTI
ncbi:Yip1 family protein [Aeoliella sp. SH292]|uniref:Yip1 family protein n=1 Tax=Aeoliella sp. SH292 TaxID=3454464 RepID=UPI003F9ADCA9